MQPNESEKDEPRSSEITAPLTKETASDFPATSNETSPTLEEALDRIRDLYRQEQAAKWGQGDQVNLIEEAHLALKKGYKQARKCLKQELPDLQPSTLYAYAFVAKHFGQEHTKRYGVSKLQRLAALHNDGGGPGPSGDPSDLEVRVPQADGSVIVKKFRDCRMSDLRSATKHRNQTRKAAGQVMRGAKVIQGAPSKAEHAPKLPAPVLWRALAMIGLGFVAGFVGDLVSSSILGTIVGVLALILTLGGMAELVRYFVSIRDRIVAGFKSGAGLKALKNEWLDVLRKGRDVVAAVRSAYPKGTPTQSGEETPPPSDKKAA